MRKPQKLGTRFNAGAPRKVQQKKMKQKVFFDAPNNLYS